MHLHEFTTCEISSFKYYSTYW